MHCRLANLKCSNQSVVNHYKDFKIEYNKMSNNIDISRNILLVNNKLSYTRRLDLEDDITCTIWIEIKIPKCKPVLIMGGYRQWQLLKILDKNNTKTRTHQLSRWKMILEKWQLALNEKKIPLF